MEKDNKYCINCKNFISYNIMYEDDQEDTELGICKLEYPSIFDQRNIEDSCDKFETKK